MLPVYCNHFGFAREPFSVTPDPKFLYLSLSHKEALSQLIYGIKSRRGFIVLTGEVGTGKTTLIQRLLDDLKGEQVRCAYLFDLTASPKDLLRSVCEEFALTTPLAKDSDVPDYLTLINRFLLASYQNGDNVVLIIDEAQNLSAEVLERVRLLSNFETKQDKLLQILLVGQPELSVRLDQPDLRQLKQRVALRHHLSPLNLSECKEYIAKRLEIAGGDVSLFSAGAIEAIHDFSGGLPRLVNILSDNGLLSAYGSRRPFVEAAMIAEIARDLHLTGLLRSFDDGPKSVAVKPTEEPPRETKERIVELTEVAAAVPQDHGPRKLFGLRLRSRAEPVTQDSNHAAKITNDVAKQPENGAARVENLSGMAPREYFERMISVLTEALGPMAPIVVQDHIAAMGETKDAFPARRLGQLVNETSHEILNELMRHRFEEVMSEQFEALEGDPKDPGKNRDARK